MMKMKFKKIREGLCVYTVASYYRYSYALFGILLLTGFFSDLNSNLATPASIVPLIIFLITLGGLGYREKWVFDRNKEVVEYINGWFLFVKRESFKFSEIKKLEITHFVRGFREEKEATKIKGRRNREMVVFSLRFNDESKRDIEIIGERQSSQKTEQAALLIATCVNLPFTNDKANNYDRLSLREL